MPGLLICAIAASSTCTPPRPYAATPGPLGTLEAQFLRARSLADQIDVARAQELLHDRKRHRRDREDLVALGTWRLVLHRIEREVGMERVVLDRWVRRTLPE